MAKLGAQFHSSFRIPSSSGRTKHTGHYTQSIYGKPSTSRTAQHGQTGIGAPEATAFRSSRTVAHRRPYRHG